MNHNRKKIKERAQHGTYGKCTQFKYKAVVYRWHGYRWLIVSLTDPRHKSRELRVKEHCYIANLLD